MNAAPRYQRVALHSLTCASEGLYRQAAISVTPISSNDVVMAPVVPVAAAAALNAAPTGTNQEFPSTAAAATAAATPGSVITDKRTGAGGGSAGERGDGGDGSWCVITAG